MNDNVTQSNSSYQELTIVELIKIIWHGKITVITTAVVVILIGVLYALSLPNLYKAEALLSPTEEARGGGMSQMAGELGGLASLAGFSFSQSSIDKTKIALEILQSREFISGFIEKHNLTADIMAIESWDPETGITYNEDVYSASQNIWLSDESSGKSFKPSAQRIVKKFNTNLIEVSSADNTGFVTISVIHQSPDVAKKITELLIKEINDTMRARDVYEAQRSLEFLERELRKTSLADMQQVFYRLIEKQTQTIMLANTRPEYIFQTLDPAVVPEERFSPNRTIIVILFALLGGFIGIALVLGINRIKSLSRQAK